MGLFQLSAPNGLGQTAEAPRISHFHEIVHDDKGRIISDVLYGRDGSIQSREEFTYELQDGSPVISRRCYDENGAYTGMNRVYRQQRQDITEIYDKKNKLVDRIVGMMTRVL